MNSSEVRDGAIGATAGIGGAVMHWFELAGKLGSSIASIVGAIIALIMLWRLIFRDGSQKETMKKGNE